MRFGTTDLTSGQWLTALALAGVAFAVPELWKLAQRRLTAAEARSRVLSTDAVRATHARRASVFSTASLVWARVARHLVRARRLGS